MTYTPVGWKDGSGNPGGDTPISMANLGIMDTGIDTLDDTVNNTTGNEAATLPSSNGPFTFVNWLNYLLTQLKAIIGGSHWYSAPPASLTSLNTNKVGKGTHNAVAGFTLSSGDGPPASLAANEYYIQRS